VVALDDKLVEIGRLGGIEGLEGEVIELFRRRNNLIYPDLAVIPMIGHRFAEAPARWSA
jgi:hypothetical protein